MTTAKQFGFAMPVGTELIKYGDNAITQNANKSAELFTRAFSGDFTPQPIPLNADLNTLGDGFWYARTASQSASILNKPTGQVDTPFEVFIRTSNEGSFKYQLQEFSGYSGARAGYWKRNTSNATGSAYLPWVRLDNELVSSTGLAGIANMLRVQEFKDAMGPITTNGRAAVALRWDHGLTNFNASIRPLLEARNFKYALALSARNFNAGENAGVTAAMVNGWTLAEVWNHGANQHKDESSIAGLTDQIVTGLTELEAALPSKNIWGYMVPGTGGTGQGGFGGGSTPEAFYKTLAGDLILTNHAVSSGSFPGTGRRVLDGEVRQGMAHFTMEAQTVARIKLEIDNAISTKTGLQLMMHPSLLNATGYLTTAQLTEVLNYIKTKQDSGEIVVLSPYEMMVAKLNTSNGGGVPGPPGAGVPDGGEALQFIRKNAFNTTTEWATLTKALVGLSNVDNTSDEDKPISRTKIDEANRVLIEDPLSETSAALSADFVKGGLGIGLTMRGGAIRNFGETEGFWKLIEDPAHLPFGIGEVTTTDKVIIVKTGGAGLKVGTVIAVTDETMAADGYFVGSSGGGSEIHISIGRRKTISDRITYDTATSTWKSDEGVYTDFSFSSGVLSFNHEAMTGQNGVSAVIHSGPTPFTSVSVASAVNAGSTSLRFHAADGSVITTPTAGCRAFVTREDNQKLGTIDPRFLLNSNVKPGHNIWLMVANH